MFARQSGDDTGFEAELRECFLVLDRMRQRGLHFDPQMAQVYQQLVGMFGATNRHDLCDLWSRARQEAAWGNRFLTGAAPQS